MNSRDLLGHDVARKPVVMLPQDNGSDVRQIAESGIYVPLPTLPPPSLERQIAGLKTDAAKCLNEYGRNFLLGTAARLQSDLNKQRKGRN